MLYSVIDIFPEEMSFRSQSCVDKYFHFMRVSSAADIRNCASAQRKCRRNSNSNYVALCAVAK